MTAPWRLWRTRKVWRLLEVTVAEAVADRDLDTIRALLIRAEGRGDFTEYDPLSSGTAHYFPPLQGGNRGWSLSGAQIAAVIERFGPLPIDKYQPDRARPDT